MQPRRPRRPITFLEMLPPAIASPRHAALSISYDVAAGTGYRNCGSSAYDVVAGQ